MSASVSFVADLYPLVPGAGVLVLRGTCTGAVYLQSCCEPQNAPEMTARLCMRHAMDMDETRVWCPCFAEVWERICDPYMTRRFEEMCRTTPPAAATETTEAVE